MESIEEKKAHYSVIKKTCYATDFIYLAVHVLYLILFLIAKVYPMVYANITSIVLYILFLFIIKKQKYYLYALCCGNEFLIFMSVATILVGFHSGFHLCIIGLCVVSFFTTYFSKESSMRNSLTWTVLSLGLYIGLYLYCHFNEPQYQIDRWLEVTLFILHSVAVFAFIAAYLIIFIKYAVSLENRITKESRIDNLTQIHNRYDLYNYLDSIDDKTDFALSMFDIDDFKKINDIYGHVCGDYILKEVASITKETLIGSFVSRFGGEEFIIISKADGRMDRVYKELETLRQKIETNDFIFDGKTIHLTITIGIEEYSSEYTIENWINRADDKLYCGKRNGKNQTVY